MSRARFSADVEADLLAIVEFIAQDNPNAALAARHCLSHGVAFAVKLQRNLFPTFLPKVRNKWICHE